MEEKASKLKWMSDAAICELLEEGLRNKTKTLETDDG